MVVTAARAIDTESSIRNRPKINDARPIHKYRVSNLSRDRFNGNLLHSIKDWNDIYDLTMFSIGWAAAGLLNRNELSAANLSTSKIIANSVQ
jgi:hypothetical protein